MDRKLFLQVMAALSFVVGLLLFLTQTRPGGEAPEALRLSFETGAVFVVGLSLIAISAALLICSFYVGKRKSNNP